MKNVMWIGTLCAGVILAIAPFVEERIAVLDLLLSLMALLMCGVGLLVYAILKLRKKAASKLLFLSPLLLMLGAVIGFLSAFLRRPPPVPAIAESVTQEIQYIHDMDQRDRYTLRFLDLSRDATRLNRIIELRDAGKIEAPQDKYRAALVFQHGHDPEHFESAHELARAASEANVAGARQLSEMAYDRWMLSIGQPQKYGTQMTFGIGGNNN